VARAVLGRVAVRVAHEALRAEHALAVQALDAPRVRTRRRLEEAKLSFLRRNSRERAVTNRPPAFYPHTKHRSQLRHCFGEMTTALLDLARKPP
jgi:hypothetical protein